MPFFVSILCSPRPSMPRAPNARPPPPFPSPNSLAHRPSNAPSPPPPSPVLFPVVDIVTRMILSILPLIFHATRTSQEPAKNNPAGCGIITAQCVACKLGPKRVMERGHSHPPEPCRNLHSITNLACCSKCCFFFSRVEAILPPAIPTPRATLLHLADNFAGLAQTLHHLQTFFPSSDRVVALLEEFVELLCSVHLFEQFSLHFIFRVPSPSLAWPIWRPPRTYSTRVNMIALGTISIIVLRVMLK